MQQVTLRVVGRLDVPGVERMLTSLPAGTAQDRELLTTIDLRRATLFDPYGLVTLRVLVRHLIQFGPVRVLSPQDPNVANYFAASRLADHLPTAVSFEPALSDTGFRQTSRSRVMAFTSFSSSADIIGIRDHCRQILEDQLDCPSDYSDDLGTALSELCQNVLDHAQDPAGGTAVAQKYVKRRGSTQIHFVVIGVGDGGIGVQASLKTKYQSQFGDDQSAITAALQGYSARSGRGGMGLRRVLDISRQYSGRIDMRSVTGLVGEGVPTFNWLPSSGRRLPGTQVSVSLYYQTNGS